MRTVLFTGAGASMPFYAPPITTDALTKHLRDTTAWTTILNTFRGINPSADIDTTTVLQLLDDTLAARPLGNFEELIELIDKTISFNTPIPGTILNDILRLNNATPRTPALSSWYDVIPFLARQLISDLVLNTLPSAQHSTYRQQQDDLLTALLTRGPVSINSLNYDDSIPASADNLGFTHGFTNDGTFDESTYLTAENPVAYLHGHTRFLMTGQEVRYDPSAANASSRRMNGLDELMSFPHDTTTWIDTKYTRVYDTFLITGQTKDPALNQNPYAAYYQRLAADLTTADLLLIVGYSFGDEHFNRLFTNYLAQDPTRQALIVGYHAGAIDVKSSFFAQDPLWKMLGTLKTGGKHSISINSTNQYATNLAALNANGWGTIFPNMTYYKRGYDAFLQDYTTILTAINTI